MKKRFWTGIYERKCEKYFNKRPKNPPIFAAVRVIRPKISLDVEIQDIAGTCA